MAADQYLVPFRIDRFREIVEPVLDDFAMRGSEAIAHLINTSPIDLDREQAAGLLEAAKLVEQEPRQDEEFEMFEIHPMYEIGSKLFRYFCRVKDPEEVCLTYSIAYETLQMHEGWNKFLSIGSDDWHIEACLGPGSMVVPSDLVSALAEGWFREHLTSLFIKTGVPELKELLQLGSLSPELGLVLITEW